MDGIGVLRALLAAQAPMHGLDPHTLRFVLEFDGTGLPPDAAQNIAALLEIDVDDFQLFPLFLTDARSDGTAPDSEFFVLQFPGLDRTVDNATLFSIAHELAAQLGAITVEPDLGTTIYTEPIESPATTEAAVRDFVIGRCLVTDPAPNDRVWALERARVLAAWDASTARGNGIRIAQPDTGVTPHRELSDSTLADGFDMFTGQPGATDPLGYEGHPGHGTRTSSVVVSGPAGTIQGVAPAATLVPIRCIESVVLAFNASAVARAIDYARQRNCDIITMSLGGTPSRAMRRAIDRAIADGMIVLAAAGNCVKLVVYPARYDDVIAVAGSNVNDAPWIGSCRGAAVDVTGPAENVWTAVPGSSGKRVGGGQGTSFAVAMTAGAAALWLSHHGTDKVRAEAASRGATVQRLFREFLVATARQPETWDAHDFGAGIIDVAALLKRPLTAPFLPGNESSAPGDDAMGLVLEAWGDDAAEVAAVAAEPQLQLELSALALEDARNGGGGAGGLESSIQREGISPQLAEALGRPTAIASRTPGRPLEGPMTGGAAVVIETPTEIVHAPAIGDVIAHQAREALIESVARNPGPSMGVLESNLHGVRTGSDDDAALERLHDQLLATAESVVKDMAAGRAIPDQVEQRTALEALVMVHGRPALRLADDGVDGSDPQLGEWAGPIFLHPDLTKLQRAVGRIDSGAGAHVGTGFVVGEGLVMTNRHVVEAIAFPAPRRYEPAAWVLAGSPTIDFSPRADDPSRRFKILEVVFSGPEPADRVDLSHLDLALLRIETVSTDDVEAPQPLTLSDEPVTLKAAKLFVIGYPALPTVLPKDAEGAIRQDVVRRLQEIFRLDFGVRYLSPGTVMQTPSELLPDTPNPLVFAHDATSLGGNSGSCVLAFDDKLRVSGLHFAGDWLRANFAHAMADVRGSFSSVLP